MKRRYFLSWGLLCPIIILIAFVVLGIGLCVKWQFDEPIKIFVFIVLLLVDILLIFAASWFLMSLAGFFILTNDTIKTKLHS